MQKIYIAGWQKHQSFRKDRGAPPWIKLHRNLFMKPNWVALSDAEKGQLISMWILAADDDGAIPADAKVLRKLCQLDDLPDIKKFIDLQWLSVDDNQMTTTCQPDDNHLTPQKRIEENRKEESIAKAKEKFPQLNLLELYDQMIDWHLSKKKTIKDYPATFRNWCRKSIEFQKEKQPEQPAKKKSIQDLTPEERAHYGY